MTNEDVLKNMVGKVAVEALEKQMSKRPIITQGCNWSYKCPHCNKLLYWTDEPNNHGEKTKYCKYCGQKLDWN